MSGTSTLEKATAIVAKHLNVDAATVTPEADFEKDLGADSLDVVELVMAFEEEFSLSVPDEEAEKLRSIKDVVSYIDGRLVAA